MSFLPRLQFPAVRVRVGTSGFSYDEWRGSFYPRELRPEGRLACIAVQESPKAEINLLPLLQKRLSIVGSTLRPQGAEAKARIAAGLEREVWPLIEAGRVRPVIDSSFPLEDAAKAHERLESNRHIGKIILTV